jgi:hypothetical protein
MTDWRVVGNVAEYAIAKSGSWHGGARQCDRSFADELPMGPRSRTSYDTSDTASPEVILLPLLTEITAFSDHCSFVANSLFRKNIPCSKE